VEVMRSDGHLWIEMWKMWVVSHHFSAKVCTKTTLVDLSGIKWIMGLKLAAWT